MIKIRIIVEKNSPRNHRTFEKWVYNKLIGLNKLHFQLNFVLNQIHL
jgi:hypothetical protein